MHVQTASDEQLLEVRSRQTAGDSFAEFYRRYERVILAFHLRRVRNAELADDLAATTFAEALVSRHRFKSSRSGDAAAWLFGIASHVLSRHRRRTEAESRRAHRLQIELSVLTHDQVTEIESLADEGPLMEALRLLPRDQREAVHAFVVDEASYDEIADRAEINPAAARKRVSRGLAAMRDGMKETR